MTKEMSRSLGKVTMMLLLESTPSILASQSFFGVLRLGKDELKLPGAITR